MLRTIFTQMTIIALIGGLLCSPCTDAIAPIEEDYECVLPDRSMDDEVHSYSIFVIKSKANNEVSSLRVYDKPKQNSRLNVTGIELDDIALISKGKVVHKGDHITLEIFENSQKGTLEDYMLTSAYPTDQREILSKFSSVVKAVNYVHQNGLVHSDIRPSTIVVDNEGKLRLAGLRRAVNDESIREARSPIYEGPGLVKGTSMVAVSPELDMWALGVLLYRMVLKKPLSLTLIEDLNTRNVEFGAFEVDKGMAVEVINILLKMLKIYSYNRSSVSEVLQAIDQTIKTPKWTYLQSNQLVHARWNVYKTENKLNEYDEEKRFAIIDFWHEGPNKTLVITGLIVVLVIFIMIFVYKAKAVVGVDEASIQLEDLKA